MTWIDMMLDELGRIELFSAPFNYLEEIEKDKQNAKSKKQPKRPAPKAAN